MDDLLFEPAFDFDFDGLSVLLIKLGADSVKPQGENAQADHCFLHENNSPTLGVSIHAPYAWNCFHPNCKRGPDIVSLVAAALKTKERSDAIAWLLANFPKSATNKKVQLSLDKAQTKRSRFVLPKTALKAYPLSASNDIGYRAIEYYKNIHGEALCSRKQADEFQLGYDLHNHRLLFPVFHGDGVLAGIIGRSMKTGVSKAHRWYNYDEGFFKKGLCLGGAELSLEPGPIVVVEGPSDYISLRARGVKNVRSTFGSEFSDTQLQMLIDYGRDIVPMFDVDEAGIAARRKFIKAVNGRRRLLPVTYPQSSFEDGKADPRNIASEDIPNLIASFGKVTLRLKST